MQLLLRAKSLMEGTMLETDPIPVVEERELPGPAATVADLPDQDDEAVAEQLKRCTANQQAAVPGDRGAWSYLLGLVRRLRARAPIRDLGYHEARLGWLSFHVPPHW
jgi:hypothetical protein